MECLTATEPHQATKFSKNNPTRYLEITTTLRSHGSVSLLLAADTKHNRLRVVTGTLRLSTATTYAGQKQLAIIGKRILKHRIRKTCHI